MEKYLIVGLGNPGEEYVNTRHNIGFDIVDSLAKKYSADFIVKKHAMFTSFRLRGRTINLLKPSTFMNLSGKAVLYHLNLKKIKSSNLFIITDDLNLPFGTIRCRRSGSSGGHNGHKDIIEKLETSDYSRLKFGIGNSFIKGKQSNYVLSQWSQQEKKCIVPLIEKSIDVVINFCFSGIDDTMKKFN